LKRNTFPIFGLCLYIGIVCIVDNKVWNDKLVARPMAEFYDGNNLVKLHYILNISYIILHRYSKRAGQFWGGVE